MSKIARFWDVARSVSSKTTNRIKDTHKKLKSLGNATTTTLRSINTLQQKRVALAMAE